MKKTILLLTFISLILSGCKNEESKVKKFIKQTGHFNPIEEKIENIEQHKTVYIPVYSHVYTSEEKYEPMGITLSIRNTDIKNKLIIENIMYYNSKGDMIQKYIEKPHSLNEMGSIDFIIDLKDMRGGSGANFIVQWAGSKNLTTPIIQAVMINNSGNRAFSFLTNGVTIK